MIYSGTTTRFTAYVCEVKLHFFLHSIFISVCYIYSWISRSEQIFYSFYKYVWEKEMSIIFLNDLTSMMY